MIEVDNLMIGDLVQIDGQFAQVSEIRYNIIAVQFSDGYDVFEPKNIDLIPLTSEMLEKNGFKFTDPWYEFDNFGVIFNENGIRCSITGKMSLYIHYVNELQHALKLFGIKKEIVL